MTPVEIDIDRFVGIADAATRLGVSRSKAYDLIHANQFPVRVVTIAGKQQVSLRALAEFIYGGKIDRANDAELERVAS